MTTNAYTRNNKHYLFSAQKVVGFVLLFLCSLAVQAITYVDTGSQWAYLDDGSDQSSAWQASGFDDSSWSTGAAELGYGDGDEATVVSFGPNAANKFVTTYFRQSFIVADASRALDLTINPAAR